MFKKILVCLDGSSLTEQILPYAAEVALCSGSKVVLLEVTVPPGAVVQPLIGYYRATPLEKIQRDGEVAGEYLQRVAKRLRRKRLHVECVTLPGDPGKTIVNYAAQNDIDLIALGTHGHSGLGRLIFGSVADFVLKHSELPILVRKPKETRK